MCVYTRVRVCLCPVCWGQGLSESCSGGGGARESRAGLYRTCPAKVGGAGWGRQEPFQVSEGEYASGYACVCVEVCLNLEGTQPYPCLRCREIKEVGGEGLALASVAPFRF